MMYPFTIYDIATGVILRNGTAKTGRYDMQTSEAEGFIIGWFEADEWLILGDEPTAKPAATPAEIEQAAREAFRVRASLSRSQFCIACKNAGILTAADAKAAAKGDWPPSMAAALPLMPDPDEAEITWAAVAQVDRSSPLVAAMQAAMAIVGTILTDNDLDDLFGWSA